MNNGRRRYATLFAAFLIILFLRVVIAQDPIRQVTAWVARPIQSVVAKLAYDGAEPNSANANNGNSQIAELQRQNQSLKDSLNFLSNAKLRGVGAEVIGKNVQSYRKSVTINRGSNQGIAKDMAVIAGDQLVGIVHEVQSDTAQVLLLGDPDFRAAVTVEGTDIAGIITSEAGGPVIAQLSVGDQRITGSRVVTSGLGGLFPPNIPAGVVGDELSKPTDVFKQYGLASAVSVSSLKHIVVVTGYEPAS